MGWCRRILFFLSLSAFKFCALFFNICCFFPSVDRPIFHVRAISFVCFFIYVLLFFFWSFFFFTRLVVYALTRELLLKWTVSVVCLVGQTEKRRWRHPNATHTKKKSQHNKWSKYNEKDFIRFPFSLDSFTSRSHSRIVI